MGQHTPRSTPLHEEPFGNFLVQSLIKYLEEHRVYNGSFQQLRSTLIQFTGRATGWPKQAAGLASHLYQCQPILEHLGVAMCQGSLKGSFEASWR